jgi:hypothetical protein
MCLATTRSLKRILQLRAQVEDVDAAWARGYGASTNLFPAHTATGTMRKMIPNPRKQQIPPLRCAPVGMTELSQNIYRDGP